MEAFRGVLPPGRTLPLRSPPRLSAGNSLHRSHCQRQVRWAEVHVSRGMQQWVVNETCQPHEPASQLYRVLWRLRTTM